MFDEGDGFKVILDGLPDPLHVVDRDLVFRYANEAFRRWGEELGFETAPEGLGFADVFPFLGGAVEDEYRQVFATGTAMSTEETTEFRGVVYSTKSRKLPLVHGGVVTHVVTVIHDVTADRTRERALRESEGRLRAFVRAMPDPAFILDEEGRYVDVLSSDESLLYRETEGLRGMTVFDVLPRPVAEAAFEGIQRTIATGEPQTIEYELQVPAGLRSFEGHSALLEGDWDGRRLILWIAFDVTARKRAEADRLRLEQQMQQVQRLESLGVLAGGIAHDFNNILVGVMGNADLILLEPGLPAGAREFAEVIKRAAARATELTNQMLAYAGKGRFVFGPLDLSSLVADTERLLRSSAAGLVTLRLDLPPGLPKVEADGAQLRQVAMNLITNAAEACSESGGTVSVRTSLVQADRELLARSYLDDPLEPGPYVALDVEDTGTGIDADTRSRMFEPFFTTKFSGRGLGLAAVLGIVRRHRGALIVESELGRGTLVRVLLPVSDGSVGVELGPAVRAGDRAVAGTVQGDVLVVDDEDLVLEVLRGMFRVLGYRVVAAASGFDALERMREDPSRFRLAVVDASMPGMSGIQTIRALHEIRPDLPVILCSGYDETDARQRWGDEGVANFVHKPFELSQLQERVRQALSGAGPQGD